MVRALCRKREQQCRRCLLLGWQVKDRNIFFDNLRKLRNKTWWRAFFVGKNLQNLCWLKEKYLNILILCTTCCYMYIKKHVVLECSFNCLSLIILRPAHKGVDQYWNQNDVTVCSPLNLLHFVHVVRNTLHVCFQCILCYFTRYK